MEMIHVMIAFIIIMTMAVGTVAMKLYMFPDEKIEGFKPLQQQVLISDDRKMLMNMLLKLLILILKLIEALRCTAQKCTQLMDTYLVEGGFPLPWIAIIHHTKPR